MAQKELAVWYVICMLECGAKIEVYSRSQRVDDAVLAASHLGWAKVNSPGKTRHLCPDCVERFMEIQKGISIQWLKKR
jgi:hypothetical protein